MSSWLNMYEVLPGLSGERIHVVNAATRPLMRSLSLLEFEIYVIDGSKIINEETFFHEIARAFDFPAYFRHNWNAWNDCLGDFGKSLSASRVAIIWEHADQTLAADAQIFLEVVCDLSNLALGASLDPMRYPEDGEEPKQVELFFLGQGEGFKAKLQLDHCST